MDKHDITAPVGTGTDTEADKTSAAEWIKTMLIVLLTVSALLFGWRTALFNDFFSAVPFFGNVADLMRSTPSDGEPVEIEAKEAARPLSIVITNKNGERFGVRYNTIARNIIYDNVSDIISGAFASALTVSEVSEAEWRNALSGAGVYFEYFKPVRLSFLAGWLGTHAAVPAENFMLGRLFVVLGDDTGRLYYQDAESGIFYGADTVSFDGKSQELESYRPNGAVFAFETGVAGASNAPYMLIMPGSEFAGIHVDPAGSATEILEITLAVLGHGNEAYTTLPDGSDAVRCVGTQFNIRIDLVGHVYYRNTGSLPYNEERYPLNENDMIEQARIIVADTVGEMCGDAEVFFEALEYETPGGCTVSFGYYIAGGRIHLPEDAFAARVTFTSGTVTGAEFNYRCFTYSGEFTRLLPEKQALAAADGEFILGYYDEGMEIMLPAWVKR